MPQPARTPTSCIWPRTCSGCRRRRAGRTIRPTPSSLSSPGARQVMLGEVIDLVSGIAKGEQGDKAKDILGRVYEYFLLHYVRMERVSNEALAVQATVLLHPKEVPLCLTGTVSKICWRSCTGTLRQRLTRSHSIVGALSMA